MAHIDISRHHLPPQRRISLLKTLYDLDHETDLKNIARSVKVFNGVQNGRVVADLCYLF